MTEGSHGPSLFRSGFFQPRRYIGHRFIAYLTVLSILPLLALGLASFEISRSALEIEARRHLSQLLHERKRYIDLQTEQIEGLIANVSGVEAITTGLSTPYDPADNYSRLLMQARIGYILNGYVNINGLVSIDIFSRGGAHYHVGDTLDVGRLRRDMLDELDRQATATTRLVYWAGIVDNVNGNSKHRKVITAAKKLYGFQQETSEQIPLGLLLVNYNVDYLKEQFGNSGSGDAMQVALIDDNGRLVYHSDSRLTGSRIDPELMVRMPGKTGTFLWEDARHAEILVSHMRSEPSGWQLAGFIPLTAIDAHAAVIGKATALAALLCLMVVAAAAVSYSRRVVVPLQRITNRFKQLQADPDLPREHLPVHGEDDVAELTGWFNAFLDSRHGQERAEAANRAKSVFLSNMSHELRTPLNAILGYAQIIKRDKNLSERQVTGLNTIQQSGEQLLMLINDILDLSKIEAGKLALYPEAVNLQAFLRGIADIIRIKAEEKSLLFVLDAAPDLPQAVRVDDKRLRQALLNLLGNAVKFSDRGQVSFRIWELHGQGAQTRLHFEVEDNRLTGGDAMVLTVAQARFHFEVEDTGIGIAESELDTIFQRFEQAGDMRRRAGGTGLGLAISRQLIRMMGSDIHVESRIGKGSRFWFDIDLPIAEVRVDTVPLEQIVTGYQGPRKKVLVVDDVAANRMVAVDLLASLGFETIEAENGRDGLEKAQAAQPDFILMDIVMPVMDGLEATHRLRQLPAFKAMPIIATSASASDVDQQKSLAVGATAFLPKPLDFNALLQQLGKLLQLTWIYEQSQEAPSAEGKAVGPLPPPPPEELEVLYHLAKAGNMRDIRERAAYLATIDERYHPFADKLRRLADGCQSKAIFDLVEAYMTKA